MPITRADGERYSAADAAMNATLAVENAGWTTLEYAKNNSASTRESVQKQFISNMQLFMFNYGGTVNRTGSGSSKIKVKEADYDLW